MGVSELIPTLKKTTHKNDNNNKMQAAIKWSNILAKILANEEKAITKKPQPLHTW